jgi:hypothetical protein
MPPFLSAPGVDKFLTPIDARQLDISPPTGVRAAKLPVVDVTIETDDDEDYLVVVRHPSGALSFHGGQEETPTRQARRRTGPSAVPRRRRITFRVPTGVTSRSDVRRGVLGDLADTALGAIRDKAEAIVVKVGQKLAGLTIGAAEAAIWKFLGRSPGLCRVSHQGLRVNQLPSVSGALTVGPQGRVLLFIHGTFSTTLGAFTDLAGTSFFAQIEAIYGDAIYGFDHYSVSLSPEDNAKEILSRLSERTVVDVVTHSRGGLVLRNLAERSEALGGTADRFELGRAVLVASPNEGTPLISADHWSAKVGWLANIIDMAGGGLDAGFVSGWIAWFAKNAVKSANGLEAMSMSGDALQRLQMPPGPQAGQYSALVSNFEANNQWLLRAADLGLDWFFGTPNDLVVPTTGGWRIDRGLEAIPSDRVACFGPGGNIDPAATHPIHHLGFFGRPETATFLINALGDRPQSLAKIDLSAPLPPRRRGVSAGVRTGELPQLLREVPSGERTTAVAPAEAADKQPLGRRSVAAQPYSSIFELTVIDPNLVTNRDEFNEEIDAVPMLLASYGGARVAVPFRTSQKHLGDLSSTVQASSPERYPVERIAQQGRELHDRWGHLFKYHRELKRYLDHDNEPEPAADSLRAFGDLLFETLLPGDVRRLYDAARSRERDKLFMVFTSMIPWVFDMPWEFARDPGRGTFLATEDVYFIRNILTPTPVQQLERTTKLHMLVAIAEPRGYAALSTSAEATRLRDELKPLTERGLLTIDVLEHATPKTLHHKAANDHLNIVHFIGHGYWEEAGLRSGLVVEDGRGEPYELGERSLREILSGRGIRVVFLNACDTGRGPTTRKRQIATVAGTAQNLFGRGVPNVVANQLKVGDQAAVAFAGAFYSYLAHGKTVAQAAREARISASYRKGVQSIDWAIPVVYARDPADALVDISTI